MSITGRQSHVLRRTGSLQRVKAGSRHEDVAKEGEDEGCEEVYAEHGTYSSTPDKCQSPLLSQKFETEPTKYFEDKIFSALFDKLLIRHVSSQLQQLSLQIILIKPQFRLKSCKTDLRAQCVWGAGARHHLLRGQGEVGGEAGPRLGGGREGPGPAPRLPGGGQHLQSREDDRQPQVWSR